MKKLIVLTLFFAVLCVNAQAQSLRTLFVEMPDTLLPLLTTNDRKDLIDFWDARMKNSVTNRLDGKSRLTVLSDDYLSIILSRSSSMQIKMLSCEGGDTLLCVVNSVNAEACDSRIHFYNNRWQRVDGNLFAMPEIADFFVQSDSVADLIRMSDIYLVSLNLSSKSDTLRADYTMPQYMTRADSSRVAAQLRTLYYRWTGKRFE